MGKAAVSKLIYFISITITLLLAIITAFGVFTPFFSPGDHPLITYIGLALPALLIINLLLVIYWAFKKKIWMWFPLIAIAINYNYLSSIFQISFSKEAKDLTIKVSTYNVHEFNKEITGYSAKQIAHYMSQEKVDIICFQEFKWNNKFTKDSLYNTFKEYPYKSVPMLPNGGTRIAIFSKYPITNSYFIPFNNSDNCGMWADIRINKKEVRVFNVHMQTTSLNQSRSELAKQRVYNNGFEGEEKALLHIGNTMLENFERRAAQARIINKFIKETKYPIILCGDFNDTPTSYTYHKMNENLKDGFKECGNGYGYTYRGFYKLLRIDYIFYSPEMYGITYVSPSLKWSDHNPVIMQIEL